jgi:glycosyltransferase involved in cell wall biosynthesis
LIDQDSRIEIRDQYLTQDEMRGLIRSSDCYISLHRSEGLGLGLAEAMYLGKPTIATAYSGNLEFMNKYNSTLIPYTLVPIPRRIYPNCEGQYWAQVDIGAAAKSMQTLVLNPAQGLNLGKQATVDIREKHSLAVAGKQIELRLNEIHKQPYKNLSSNR